MEVLIYLHYSYRSVLAGFSKAVVIVWYATEANAIRITINQLSRKTSGLILI
jgi:hypothetical protein